MWLVRPLAGWPRPRLGCRRLPWAAAACLAPPLAAVAASRVTGEEGANFLREFEERASAAALQLPLAQRHTSLGPCLLKKL